MRGNQRWTRRPHALPAAAARFVDAFERVSNDVGTPRCRRRRYPADRFYDLMRTRRDAGATRKSSPRPQSCAAPVVSRRLGPRLRPADRPKSAAPSQFAPLNNKSINSATVFQFFFRARRGALGFTRWKNLKCDTKESISVFFVDTIPNEGIKFLVLLSAVYKSINNATVFQFFFGSGAALSASLDGRIWNATRRNRFLFFFVVDTIPNEGIKVPSRLSGSTHTD